MCGIVSIFNIKEQTPELRQKALRMSGKIRHRGPDWSGIYCGGGAPFTPTSPARLCAPVGEVTPFIPAKKTGLAGHRGI